MDPVQVPLTARRGFDANSLSLLALSLALSPQHPEFSRFQGGSYLSLQLLVRSEHSIPHTPCVRGMGKEPETDISLRQRKVGRRWRGGHAHLLLPPGTRKGSLLQAGLRAPSLTLLSFLFPPLSPAVTVFLLLPFCLTVTLFLSSPSFSSLLDPRCSYTGPGCSSQHPTTRAAHSISGRSEAFF